jgi:hypothetical protein
MSLYTNPGEQASKDLQQIPGQVQPYYQPYINAGNQSMSALGNQIASLLGGGSQLQSTYGSMMSNPGGYLNSIGAGYQQSPGYQYELQQGQDAVSNAAASGGYVGTPQEQQYMANTTEGIANQDYNDWLNHTMSILQIGIGGAQGMYNTGFGGAENINKMGYDASNSMAETIAQSLMQQANLDYASQVNQNQHNMGVAGASAGLVSNMLHPRNSSSNGNTSAGAGAASLAMLALM